jgi:2-keto-4-pentenoate hydratase
VTTRTAIDEAVERLQAAASNRVPCAPVRELIGATDVAAAYGVQAELIADRVRRGSRRVGRKIGLTSLAVQQQLGVDQPDFGVLLDDMSVADGGVAAVERLLQPKVEGEVAFRLRADLDGDPDYQTVRAAVASAHAAIEIVDSRIAGWDIRIADTVADNASSGMFVVSEFGVALDGFEPADVTMSLELNGQLASSGDGRACLGDPLNALQWLARAAAKFGDPLRAGDLILSGALGPMVAVGRGDHARVEISGLGAVSATLEMEG